MIEDRGIMEEEAYTTALPVRFIIDIGIGLLLVIFISTESISNILSHNKNSTNENTRVS